MRLSVRLFGELDLRLGETPLPPLGSGRAESLLAYLLLHRHTPQPRQRLAFVLWPDSTEAQARTNLRHVLHVLRSALPEADRFLDVGPRTLQWRAGAPCWLDVAAFEDALAGDDLQEAAALYTADLLEGYYDDWALVERERLRRCHADALERLIPTLETRGDHGAAIGYAERLLRHDPLQERVYRTLMHLHDRRGDRARAVRVYHECAATLERELGVEPSALTRDAYAALLASEQAPVTGTPQSGSPFVGREREWERLTGLWREAEQGRARFVLVTGEPGIGKTRLLEELRSWCANRGAACAEARSYQAEGALAYGPVVSWLRSPDIRGRLDRLAGGRRRDLARLLPELTADAGAADAPASAESEQRARLFDAAASVLVAPGRRLLLVVDDVQWSDAGTLQFLHYVLRSDLQAPLLVAATARSGEVGPGRPLGELLAGLHALDCANELELGPLSLAETAALAAQTGSSALDGDAVHRLFAETEGNPLFVVEALRSGRRPGGDAGWTSAKVQAAIESHLARLSPPARDLVAVAATVGEAFTAGLLGSAGDVDGETVVQALDELWRHRIVREHGGDAYDLSHDKVREVVYGALGPVRRRHLHLRVARAMEAGPDPAAVSGRLAAHYEQAGEAAAAAAWYRRAAGAAHRVYASAEAVRLLERGLALVRAPAEELAMLTALPGPLTAVESYASPRLTEVHERVLALSGELGLEPEPPVLRSLAIAALTRGDFATARAVGERLGARGQADGDAILLVEGEYVLGVAAFWQADFAVAKNHLEAAVREYRQEHRDAHLVHYGQDPKVLCMSRLANTLWFLGDEEAASRASEAALAFAEETGHPYSHAVALVFGSLLAVDAGDADRLGRLAGDLARGGRQFGPHVALFVDAAEGLLDALGGRAGGVARIERALAEPAPARHAPGFSAVLTRLLLAAHEAGDDAEAGLAATARLLDVTGGAVWEAEARRLRAGFLARLGAPAGEVDAELHRALDVARAQGAAAFERRVRRRLDRNAPGTLRR